MLLLLLLLRLYLLLLRKQGILYLLSLLLGLLLLLKLVLLCIHMINTGISFGNLILTERYFYGRLQLFSTDSSMGSNLLNVCLQTEILFRVPFLGQLFSVICVNIKPPELF